MEIAGDEHEKEGLYSFNKQPKRLAVASAALDRLDILAAEKFTVSHAKSSNHDCKPKNWMSCKGHRPPPTTSSRLWLG